MDNWLIAAFGALGVVFGSFANVAIHRIPEGQSVVRPASACPGCGTPIAPRDNVPILSWLLLRGRCRQCGEPISPRYPLVEAAGGLLFAAMAWRIGLDPVLPAYLLLAWLLLVVAVIDARTKRIPNRLTYPLTPALALLFVAGGLLAGQPAAAVRALLGALAGFAALLVLALISPRGMGMGDVKLAAPLGLGLGYLSWGHVVLGLFGGFMLGGGASLLLVATRIAGRKDHIPFGPFLAGGTLVAILAGQPLIDAYLRATGLR
jgi:leader peptidase (prepilin peptidase) / N-methyltransferase